MAKKSKKQPIGRDTYNVQKDKYYIWTWRPKSYWKRPGVMAAYKKHVSAQPFYTRYHAKRTAVAHLGVDALAYIRVVSGRYLLKRGITCFPYKRLKYRVFYKGKPRGMPPWVMPPEYRFGRNPRKCFRELLARKAKKGRKEFNEFYAFALYGYVESLDKKYLAKERRKVRDQILQDLQKTGDI